MLRLPNFRLRRRSSIFAAMLLVCSWPAAGKQDGAAGQQNGAAAPEAKILLYPDIHQDFVVFVHGGDLWRAPAAGGTARQLTSHPGTELIPKISPDGAWIAFTAEYTGTRQIYVIPAAGGTPRQLTFYNDVGTMPPRGGFDSWIQGWTPDGKILVRMNRTPWGVRMGLYYLVDPAGGLETPLPIPHGGSASLSPDGGKLAYTPVDREFRTWKRTRGGRAQDIWIYDFGAQASRRLTEDPSTDNFPMWVGDQVYFTSDWSDTLNLFRTPAAGGAKTQVTTFSEYDVLWPSHGPGGGASGVGQIVFVNGGGLHRLDLGDEQVQPIPVSIGTDAPRRVAHLKDVSEFIRSGDISPSGKRAVFDARGDLFSVPAEHGPTRNLTTTPGVREIDPAWSPDGRWIAYLSDASGEYEIYVRPQDGTGEARRLTNDGDVWRFPPLWSPDSSKLAFSDRDRRLHILDVESGATTEVDRGRTQDILHYRWSPDSDWLVYQNSDDSRLPGIFLHSLEDGRQLRVGDGLTNDYEPVFSADGHYLFFLSDRDYQLRFSSFEFNYLYDRATRVYAAALHPEAPPLFPLRSDEESSKDDAAVEAGADEAAEDQGKKGKNKKGTGDGSSDDAEAMPRMQIEPEGFLARTIALPELGAGDYGGLVAGDGAVFYARRNQDSGAFELFRFDLEGRQETKLLSAIQDYSLSGDGKKLLFNTGSWGIADASGPIEAGGSALDLSGLRLRVDPQTEWAQIYEDAWRITRDWFYDPEMHGFDWAALGERYRALVPYVTSRAELDFLLGELVSELEAGHTYVQTGDQAEVERIEGGMLGAELELDAAAGRYRIAKIFPGENWDPTLRSPLTEPGVNVAEGEFLLAVDGQPLAAQDNPYRLLEGKADRQVELLVNGTPSLEGARRVRIHTISTERNLRYMDWVKSRMELVDRLSDGRIGYIHLPNTAFAGNRMLQRLFYGQANKPALIIDDRYNGGGFIPDRMIEMLTRDTMAYWARRDVESMRTPGFAHDGPKAMLANAFSSSGGDALPYFFRQQNLGPIIGTRTWGGLIGLSGNADFVDGGSLAVPSFRLYDPESGEWVVENEGVSPDIEVFDVPEGFLEGGDPSIEKAVEVLLAELAAKAPRRPEPPPTPDLSGPTP